MFPEYSSMPSIVKGQRVLVVDYGDYIDHMPYDDCLSIARAIDIYRRLGGGRGYFSSKNAANRKKVN